jgi:predicted DNA-binding helix-hairpin-helix protein
VYLYDVNVSTVADVVLLKDQFSKRFAPGTKQHKDYNWYDFSNVQHEDVYLEDDFGTMEAYIEIPEGPDQWAVRLGKYNERLSVYNEWAKDKKVEIAAEEKRREAAALRKKQGMIEDINAKIVQLTAEAKGLEDEIL